MESRAGEDAKKDQQTSSTELRLYNKRHLWTGFIFFGCLPELQKTIGSVSS